MSGNPNKLSQFWQELKRRKVIYVITVYASAAFVIIELANNVVEPLNLPERTPTIAIIVLAIGFPIAVILSWIFDLTRKGMEKTRPLAESPELERPAIKNGWKIATYASIAVIIGLIILNLTSSPSKLKAGDIQSLVVLPFDNFTGDDGLEYFVSGMHASLIGDMGKVSGLRVISKTSSNIYKDADMSVPQIASELDVDAVVEAQVMCLGDSICLQVKVVSVYPEEKQLWVAEFKEERNQILNLYNRVTKQIASEVKIELTPNEENLLAKSKIINTEAYDAYLKGLHYWDQFTAESLQQALDYFNKAIQLDPDWAPPYAGLAYYWIAIRQYGLAPASVTVPQIYNHIKKAFELDPNSANTLYVSALASVWTEFNWRKGENEFLKVLEINPNDAFCRIYYAHLLMSLKRDDEAIEQGHLALDLDPLNPMIQALYAMVLAYTGETEKAIEVAETALSIAPGNGAALSALATGYLNKGEYCKSFEEWIKYLPFDENSAMAIVNTCVGEGYISAANKLAEEYEKAGQVLPMEIAQFYFIANNPSKALDWMEKGFEDQDASMPYIGLNWYLTGPFKVDDPRFDELVNKMNLPSP